MSEASVSPIAVLTAPEHFMTKRFRLGGDGNLEVVPYGQAKYFEVEIHNISGIKELSALLSKWESEEHRFIIRGELADDVDLSMRVRRKMRTEGGIPNEEPFLDSPQPWLMLDVDKHLLPDNISLLEEPERAIHHLIEQLPTEFHRAKVHWQLSSSAGVRDKNHISAHLFYWLDQPISNEVLRRWGKAVNAESSRRLIDTALFSSVQIHYTAAPIFEDGVNNPFKENRSGFLDEGREECVSIDLSINERVSRVTKSRGGSDYEYDKSKTRGFTNILAEMGDQEGGIGFNLPLIRATASYVSKVGGEETEEEREELKEYLKACIDQADQSNHSVSEIEKYKTNKWLDDEITGAIKKYGDHKSLPPYFSSTSLTVECGSAKLEAAISQFAQDIVTYEDVDKHTSPPPMLGIKATAGLGKTSQIIKKLITEHLIKRGDIHYYVPSHRLSKELVKNLEAELDITLQDGSIYKRVRLIAGRGHKDEGGSPLCRKSKLAKKVAKMGEGVQSTLCRSNRGICEYYPDCAYQKQFEGAQNLLPYDDKYFEIYPSVLVFAHAHLFLHTKDRWRQQPIVAVVDEAFYSSAHWDEKVRPGELVQTDKPISKFINDRLLKGEERLLERLREEGWESVDLEREAGEIEAEEIRDDTTITPDMDESSQRRLIDRGIKKKKKVPLLLRQLAEEMRISDRAITHSVHYLYDNNKDEDAFFVRGRSGLTISNGVPTIFIDADLDSEILSLFTEDDVPIKEIPVERQAEVHQFTDRTFSTQKLSREGKKSEELMGEVREFIAGVASQGLTLVACTKKIRLILTGEDKKEADKAPHGGSCAGATVIHFGNLRGVDEYKGYENVIVLGREQPPSTGIENTARGLWWDAEIPLTLLEEKGGGSKPLDMEWRGYRIRGKEKSKGVRVLVHPDSRVERIMEQTRECESVQVIDRLRLLRGEEKRKVFILSSVPLDITVDYQWSWEKLQLFLPLWREAEGVLPLNPAHMMKRCPKSVGSERTAERRSKELKTATSLIIYIIRKVAVYSVNYSLPSQKKPFTAIVAGNVSAGERDSILAGLVEVEVGSLVVKVSAVFRSHTPSGMMKPN